MGSTYSHSVFVALQELLLGKRLKNCKEAAEKGQEASESSSSSLDSEEDEEMAELLAEAKWLSLQEKKREKRRKWGEKEKWKEGGCTGDKRGGDHVTLLPTAPPPPPPYMNKEETFQLGRSSCPEAWQQAQRELQLSFPVWVDPQGQRYHQPLDFKTIKSLAESVRTYGTTASFTVAQLEALQGYCMTPTDWAQLAKACLSPGQYLDWKAFNIEFATEQAAANVAAGDGRVAWDRDMLLGQGRFVNQQNGFPDIVYGQIGECAVKAWKALPNKGEVAGNLTKITQGPLEPFSDFVARMVEAAGRIFGDPDTAMPLIKQLIYEQCTKECRAAITPYKHRGLEVWMKVCREIGGPLTNAGLAAAVMQMSNKSGRSGSQRSGRCFLCGQPGHMKRDCPNRNKVADKGPKPGLCPRCKKGNHWANECRSIKDINGQPLESGFGGARSKNGQRGPRPQGPQIYGAMEDTPVTTPKPSLQPRSRGEPLKVPQDWISVPPPDSY